MVDVKGELGGVRIERVQAEKVTETTFQQEMSQITVFLSSNFNGHDSSTLMSYFLLNQLVICNIIANSEGSGCVSWLL
jgi:hypothetical protein